MKLWHSFVKELRLSSRGYYFYVELVMAVILLAVVLFAVPEEFVSKFASSLGLVVTSFYKNMVQAFGAIYLLMIAMFLPNIAYFIPSWEPVWIKIIPTYPLIQGFKETILANRDTSYTLMASLGFLATGTLLFLIADKRFKNTLKV
ncbi:MAG: hypothetical protein U9N81_00475 [Bacillota bacterium]|nr:hypothetical protein [Bacillota bacterium]